MTTTKTSSRTAAKPAAKAPAEQPAPVEQKRVQHDSLASALAAFQGECPPIRKSNTATVPTKNGGSYKYDYADLSDVIEVVEPVLSRHGLSFHGKPTVTKHGFGLKYTLRHTSGEVDRGFYPLPDPIRTPQQEMGSALTYIRRYVLCAVVGVAPGGDDDDAQTAQQYAQQQQHQQRLQQAQQRSQRPQGQQAAPAQQRPADAVDWVARAEAAVTPTDLGNVWTAARAAGAGTDVLDSITAVGRRRQAEAQRQLAVEAQEAATEPPQDPDEAEAAAVAAHEAEPARPEAVQA